MKAAGPTTQQADAALLGLILEAAVEGIVFVKSDNTIGYINKVGREILRCSRQDDPPPTCDELTTKLGFDPLAFSQEGDATLSLRPPDLSTETKCVTHVPGLICYPCPWLHGEGWDNETLRQNPLTPTLSPNFGVEGENGQCISPKGTYAGKKDSDS